MPAIVVRAGAIRMTSMGIVLAAAAAAGMVFHAGWYAGTRWRRAHDAARYAQIECRRMARLVRQCETIGAGLASAAAASKAIENRPQILVDYAFAVDALARSGYDVTPTLKQAEKH